jgi:hypothetical protein
MDSQSIENVTESLAKLKTSVANGDNYKELSNNLINHFIAFETDSENFKSIHAEILIFLFYINGQFDEALNRRTHYKVNIYINIRIKELLTYLMN